MTHPLELWVEVPTRSHLLVTESALAAVAAATFALSCSSFPGSTQGVRKTAESFRQGSSGIWFRPGSTRKHKIFLRGLAG